MSTPPTITERVLGFSILFFIGILLAHISAKKLIELSATAKPAPAAQLQAVGSTISPARDPLDYEVAPDEPLQASIAFPKTFSFKGYDMSELAHFRASAVLLSKHAYSAADASPSNAEHRRVLSPCDFAIGWGPMSNPSVLKNFTYFQRDRFFFYAAFMDFIDRSHELKSDYHVANIHIIPADDTVAAALEKVQPRDIVTIEGSLIEISFRKQVLWKSSLSRTDTGDGACELLFLTHLSWTSHPSSTQEIPLPKMPELPALAQ